MKVRHNKLEIDDTLMVGVIPNTPTSNFSVLFETSGIVQKRLLGSIIDKNIDEYLPYVSNSFPDIFNFNVSTTYSNPNLIVSLKNQVKGTVFMAPLNANGTPAFRKIQDADLDSTTIFTQLQNFITTNTTQTGLTGDKSSNGNWTMRTLNLFPRGGSTVVARDDSSLRVETTSTSSIAQMILTHKWTGKNLTFGLGGTGQSGAVMSNWGFYRWLNDRTENGSDGFFGFGNDNDFVRGTSFVGNGDRMVYADSNGYLRTMPLPVSPTVNDGQLTLSTSSDLTGSATFTANQATNSTFSVGLASATLTKINNGQTAFGWGNHSGLYLEKSTLNLAPSSAWDALNENRIVYSGSNANSPYSNYGIGINLYNSDTIRGQIFINTLGTGQQNLQFRSGTSSGWSAVKTVWDNTNLINVSQLVNDAGYITSSSIGNFVLKTGDTMSGSLNFTTTQMLQYSGVTRFGANATNTIIASNTANDSTTQGLQLRPVAYASTENQVLISGDGFIRTSNHGNSSQWYTAYTWGRGLRIDGNSIPVDNALNTNVFNLRNTSVWATSSQNRPANTNSAIVNFTPFNQNGNTYGFSLGARNNKLYFVTEENSVFGSWNEVIHTGNISTYIPNTIGVSYNTGSNLITASGIDVDTLTGSQVYLGTSPVGLPFSGSSIIQHYAISSGTHVTFAVDYTNGKNDYYMATGTTTPVNSNWVKFWTDKNLINVSQLTNNANYTTLSIVQTWVNSQNFSTQTLTAGTGISIVGSTINNTSPNIVQELSISGQNLSLSGGGGTVVIPTSPDTVTRLRGTASGTYVSGDLTLLAGANTTITQSGNNITIASSNTTYSAGTLALLTTGTDTVNRVWRADYLYQGIKALTFNPDNLIFGTGLTYNPTTGTLNASQDTIFAYSTQGGLYTTNWSSNALSQYAIAIGHSTNATGQSSTAIGDGVFTGGFGSSTIGHSNSTTKELASNIGTYNSNNSAISGTYGVGLLNKQDGLFVIGRYNKPTTSESYYGSIGERQKLPVFVVGIGLDEQERLDGLTVFADGRADYIDYDEATWTEHTLVTKGYVDSHSGGGGSFASYVQSRTESSITLIQTSTYLNQYDHFTLRASHPTNPQDVYADDTTYKEGLRLDVSYVADGGKFYGRVSNNINQIVTNFASSPNTTYSFVWNVSNQAWNLIGKYSNVL